MTIVHCDIRSVGPFRRISMHHLAAASIGRPITEADRISQGITVLICCRDVKSDSLARIIRAGWHSG